MQFPQGARFAFTVLDDTDDATVANARPVYQLLHRLNLRFTKTVWALDTAPENQGPFFAGETLSNSENLEWVRELSSQGFEIAFHNATMASSNRSDTIRALDLLEQEYGFSIRLHCNHGLNLENLHWGKHRYSFKLLRALMGFRAKVGGGPEFLGSDLDSPYYWADIADERIDYLRAFAYRKLNCAKISPGRPFLDPKKQSKTVFFNTSDASDISAFNELVTPASIDQLKQEGGWSIVSTHFGKGFSKDGRVDPEFENTMDYLSEQGGWYVPVSELLDYLSSSLGAGEISHLETLRMECSHVLDRFMN